MTITINTNRIIKSFAIISVFKILLDISYGLIISPLFEYTGFINHFSIQNLIISWTVLIFIFLCGSKDIIDSDSISSIIICILINLSVVPFTTLIMFGVLHGMFIIENTVFWILLLLSHWLIKNKNSSTYEMRLSTKFEFVGNSQLKAIVLVLFITTFFVSWKYTNFRINVSIFDVYGIREEASYYNLPTIIEYLLSWSHYITIVLLAYFIIRKEMVWIILCILIQILNFGIDGSKTSLFLTIIAIIVCIPKQLRLRKMNKIITGSGIIILILGLIQFIFTGDFLIASYFSRRTLLLPAYLENCYYDYFSTHTPDFFRNSFLSRLGLTSPYGNISKLIGYVYFNNAKMFANNGLISDSLTNLGVLGIIIYPIVLSFTLEWIDQSTSGLNVKMYFVVGLYIALALVNSFYLTIMLTHGLLFLILVLFSIKRDGVSLTMPKKTKG